MSEEKPVQTRRDRLKTAAAVVGLSLFAPTMLCFGIACIIAGRFPGKHGSGLTASEHPVIFFSLAFVWVAAFLPVALFAVAFAAGYALSRTSTEPAYAGRRRLLFNLHRRLLLFVRGYFALFTRLERRK